MRTKLTADDDDPAVVWAMAQRCGASLGQDPSELARRGLRETETVIEEHGLPVFAIRRDAAPITSAEVYKALGEWP